MNKGNAEKARALFSQSLTLDDNDPQRCVALGLAEARLGHYFDAAQAYHQAVVLAPSRYEPHYDIGLVFQSAGLYARAIPEFETALRLAPDQPEVMENLAQCLLRRQENLAHARDLMDRALQFEQRSEWRSWLRLQSLRLSLKLEAATQPTRNGEPATQPASAGTAPVAPGMPKDRPQ